MSGHLRRLVAAASAVLTATTLAVAGIAPMPLRTGPAAAAEVDGGYWLLAADGSMLTFGGTRLHGANRNTGFDIVGGAGTLGAGGYWMVDDDGDVFAYGDAADFGSRVYNAGDVVGFAARPQGDGYWLVASDGGIFAFGDAPFHGSTGAIRLNRPIVGMAATPTGGGYWLVASDGGIFAFGDAPFHGSTGAIRLNRPIVGMAATPTGGGYWLVASDGGIFAFGDAPFHGSGAALGLSQPFVGIIAALPPPPEPPVVEAPPPPPDARPLAVADRVTLDEDTSVVVPVLANDTGLEDGGLVVTVENRPPNGTATVAPGGRILYRPDPDYSGRDVFTYRVTDGDGDSDMAAVTVTVAAVNDPPRITAIDDRLIAEDGSTGPLPFAVDDPDDPLEALTVTATSSNPGLVPDAAVSLAGAGAARWVTVTPEADAFGATRITLTVTDPTGASASTSFTVVVVPVDDLPVARPDAAATNEDEPVTIDVAANDLGLGDGGITVTVDPRTLDQATEGTATVDGTDITFTPAPDVNGIVTFDYVLADADGDTATATVTVTVAAVNDPPAIDPIGDVVAVLDVVDPVVVAVDDPDDPLDALTVTATSADQTHVADSDLTVTGTGGSRLLQIVPQPGATGSTLITVTVTDPGGAEASTFFTLTSP